MRTSLFVLGLGIIVFSVRLSAEKGGEGEESGPYEVDTKFLVQPMEPRPGYILGSKSGVFAESPDRIFIANRGELKLPEKLPSTQPKKIYTPPYDGSWGSLGLNAAVAVRSIEIRNCIIVVDRNGKKLESWTQWDHLFEGGRGPHSVKISPYDPDRHVWVVDDRVQQVFKFTNDGQKLVMTLGIRGVAGNDETHFNQPTDIAFLPTATSS